MKKRAVSLLLILSLLLAMLSFGPLSTAEESAAPEEASEWIAPEEIEEAPVEEAPVEEAQEPVEGEGSEAAPAESEQTEVEPLFPEEGGAGDAPVEAEPVEEEPIEEAPEVVAPVEEELVEHPVFAPVEEEPVEEALANLDALRRVPALGSDNVRYEGVAYLSQAAFNSMSEVQQDSYVEMVDDMNSLLDRGIAIDNIVFSLDENGTLGLDFTLPWELFAEGGLEALAEEAPESAPEAEDFAAPEELVAPEEFIPEAAEPESAPASDGPIVENVELAKRVRVPIQYVGGSRATYISRAAARSFGSTFSNGVNIFYDQLPDETKRYYDAGKHDMVDSGKNGFEVTVDNYDDALTHIVDSVSALMLTYPGKFEWRGMGSKVVDGVKQGQGLSASVYGAADGGFTVKTAIDVSEHYTADLERHAQAKIAERVQAARQYAQEKYPDDVEYGIVRYLDDWLCANNYYNMLGTSDQVDLPDYYYCHSSYGTLLMGYGVCESYALALARMLDAAGIPNLYATGEANGGSGYGGHAWNYVRMFDGKYYLMDSTWDDLVYTDGSSHETTRKYLLCADDGKHRPTGMQYQSGNAFEYPSASTAKYEPAKAKPAVTDTPEPSHPVVAIPTDTPEPTPELIASELYLAKGGASTLKILDSTYAAKKYKKTWTSSDKSVATVSSSGKVTAVKPGIATVTLKIDGKSKAKCSVHVYQFTGLYFENGKTSRSKTFTSHGEMTEQLFHLSVKQKSKRMTAEELQEKKGLKVSVSTSKSSVATASAALTGDEIALTVTPHGLGSATITVKFGGKTATLSFKVRRALEDDWFKLSSERLTYSGKAHKPSVLLADDADVANGVAGHYSVSYSKNKNAGTASVTITGSGNYTGSVTKTFEIMPKDLATAVNLTISKPASKTYTGTARSASLSVKLNKTALKLGSDYVIRYDGAAAKPVNAGKYSVTIEGRGNYTGTPDIARSFIVKRASISNLKVTANATVKYSGDPIALSKLKLRVKLGGNVLPASDYSVRYKASNGTISDDPPTARGTYKLIITPTGGNIATTSKKKTITKSFKVTK